MKPQQTEARQTRIKLETRVLALLMNGSAGEISKLLDIPLDVAEGTASAFLTTHQLFKEERKFATYSEEEVIDRSENQFNQALVRSLFREKQRHD